MVIHWTPTVAERLACVMFQVDEASPEEVRDLLGEMANLVGGNIKGMLPGPSRLSLPVVAPPVDHSALGEQVVREACSSVPASQSS